jgi:hypothetical protein
VSPASQLGKRSSLEVGVKGWVVGVWGVGFRVWGVGGEAWGLGTRG